MIGRPSGHPTHAKYAKSINSVFIHEDKYLRWQDQNATKFKRYLSWIINAFLFPKLSHWDVIFTECVRIPPLIQKRLGLLRKRQKLVALMSDESLFFTYSNKFPKITKWLMISFWKSCDAIICIGSFQMELARKLLPEKEHTKIYQIYNGIPEDRIDKLMSVKPNLSSHNILFIGNAAVNWRANYKGLDIMIDALELCLSKTNFQFYMVGDISDEVKEYLMSRASNELKPHLHFEGYAEDIVDTMKNSSLYLHTARGEAWGISVTESLSAGIPTIISNMTGAKEVVEKINPDWVLPLDPNLIAESIVEYFETDLSVKQALSKKAKLVMENYTENNAIKEFKAVFYQSINNQQ